MKISATRIVEQPKTVASEARTVTGTMPPPPPPDQPILVAVITPVRPAASAQAGAAEATPSQAPTEAAPAAKLPNTASPLPLIALLGILALASPLAFRFIRKRA